MNGDGDVTRIEGNPPEPPEAVEKFRNERRVRLAVRTSLAQIVRPLTGMLPVPEAFTVAEEELAYLREWFEDQVARHKEEKDNGSV